MHLELKDITPPLAVFTIICSAIASFDLFLHDKHKRHAFLFIASLVQIGNRPRTLNFYGLMTLVSLGFTFVIVSVNGTIVALDGEHYSILRAFRGSGSLVFPIFLKVILWDYLMALKSFMVFRYIQNADSPLAAAFRRKRLHYIPLTVFISLDLWLTGVLTAGLLNWSEVFQSAHVESIKHSIPTIAEGFSAFFNEISLMITDSVQKCFYVLNGSLFMYASLCFATLASSAGEHINAEEMQRNLFKILGTFTMLVLMVILVCYMLAN